jgi:hypothetical protein
LFTNLFCSLQLIFFEISLTFISPKPSDVQLLSTRHVTKVHLLQKFLDLQKHALIDNILSTCGNLSRFSFTWKNVCTKGNVFTIQFPFLRNPTEEFPECYLCHIYWHQILGLSLRYWVDVPINLQEYDSFINTGDWWGFLKYFC